MLLTISLGIIIALAILSVILGGDWGAINMVVAGQESTFGIDSLEGAIGIIIIIILIGALIGINIMGSGLNDQSVKLIMIVLFYVGLWLIFSLLSFPLFYNIALFGLLLYIVLTILFIIGIIDKFTTKGGK